MAPKPKPLRIDQQLAFDEMAEAVAAFLETVGFRANTVRDPRVRWGSQGSEARFELVVGFDGEKVEEEKKAG